MITVDPTINRNYVTTSKTRNPMLYMQLYKCVYGLLRSALLFYWKLKGKLEDYGFKLNLCKVCTANIDTPGGQVIVI